jgi:hypothetical protein
LDTWFDYNMILEYMKVPFAKLKLKSLAKLLVIEHVANRNPITTWTRLMEALSFMFYPSSYKHDMNGKWCNILTIIPSLINA